MVKDHFAFTQKISPFLFFLRMWFHFNDVDDIAADES